MTGRIIRFDAPRFGALISLIALLTACGGSATCPDGPVESSESAGAEVAAIRVPPTRLAGGV